MTKTKSNYDYMVIHLNGANRTIDSETTDATVIHPLSKRCEEHLKSHYEDDIVGGALLKEGLGGDVLQKLEEKDFKEFISFSTTVMGEMDKVREQANV